MQNSEEKRNIELNSKQKSGWIKIAVIIVVIAAAFYGYKAWNGRRQHRHSLQNRSSS